jgi:hypothetical protein
MRVDEGSLKREVIVSAALDALVAVLIYDKMEERDGDRFRQQVHKALLPAAPGQPPSRKRTLAHGAAEGSGNLAAVSPGAHAL